MIETTLFPLSATPRVFEEASVEHLAGLDGAYRRVVGEFWTAQQRQMDRLHYLISYRASFKPELPAYFIDRLCPPGGVVYDPFTGRGTTALQANLMGRPAVGSDINPLAVRISRAKCRPVPVEAVERRLAEVDWDAKLDLDEAVAEFPNAGAGALSRKQSPITLDDLLPFYHPDTLRQLLNLRKFLAQSEIRNPKSEISDVDAFIELVALSRLHGHSDGFLSVYSFPQISVPPRGQRRINAQRDQQPEFRPVAQRILRKARRALDGMDIARVREVARGDRFFVADAGGASNDDLPDGSVDLIVTSPPFLAKADYLADNWLEFWFARIDPRSLRQTLVQTPKLDLWREFIGRTMARLARALKVGGHAVIEVGEVEHEGRVVHLDEVIVELAAGGLHEEARRDTKKKRGMRNAEPGIQSEIRTPKFEMHLAVVEVLIHSQKFTKLANCFNVTNNAKGTNTNRLVVLRRV